MIKNFFIFIVLLSNVSCAESGLALLIGGSSSGKESHYKYKCKKAGDCCEVGKDCEEEGSKNRKTKSGS